MREYRGQPVDYGEPMNPVEEGRLCSAFRSKPDRELLQYYVVVRKESEVGKLLNRILRERDLL